jgi:hypothetical protein
MYNSNYSAKACTLGTALLKHSLDASTRLRNLKLDTIRASLLDTIRACLLDTPLLDTIRACLLDTPMLDTIRASRYIDYRYLNYRYLANLWF